MQIQITIQDADVQAALLQLKEKVGNLKPAMDEIGQYYKRSVLDNFAAESSPDGTRWQPLSQTSIMMRLMKKTGKKYADGTAKRWGVDKSGQSLNSRGERFWNNKKLLFQSGDLLRSINYQATNDNVTIGSSGGIKYAAIHQFGGPAGRGRKVKIPARPFLAVNRGTTMELAPKDKIQTSSIFDA